MSWLTDAAHAAVGRRLVLGVIRLLLAALAGAFAVDAVDGDPLADGQPAAAIERCES